MEKLKKIGEFYKGETLTVEAFPFGVKRILFTRPQVKNAFDSRMRQELTEALTQLAAIPDAHDMRLLVLQGEGDVFCAGADLSDMKAQAAKNEAQNFQDARALGQMFYKLALFPTPVVAAVTGAAIGGGLGFAACSDHVLSTPETVFATSEVLLGIVPGVISPYILRRVGVGHAASFMMSGRRMSGEEAMRVGLVQELAPKESFEEALESTLFQFLMAGPNASRATKELIRRASPLPEPPLFEFTARKIAEARCSPEGQAGLQSFFEKKVSPWAEAPRQLKNRTEA